LAGGCSSRDPGPPRGAPRRAPRTPGVLGRDWLGRRVAAPWAVFDWRRRIAAGADGADPRQLVRSSPRCASRAIRCGRSPAPSA